MYRLPERVSIDTALRWHLDQTAMARERLSCVRLNGRPIPASIVQIVYDLAGLSIHITESAKDLSLPEEAWALLASFEADRDGDDANGIP